MLVTHKAYISQKKAKIQMDSSIPAHSNENDNRFLRNFNFIKAETYHNEFFVKTFLQKINNM